MDFNKLKAIIKLRKHGWKCCLKIYGGGGAGTYLGGFTKFYPNNKYTLRT